ncbi:HAD-like domain-containing protein [Chytriomyces sp. MP71]|nr:HAD-like domain-containing protein [Chytriomyces sp. MP71]
MRKFSLLALDMDGTVLDGRWKVSARTAAAVARVAESGAIVTLCTGRAFENTHFVETQLGRSLFCICANGAVAVAPVKDLTQVGDASVRTVFFEHTLDASKVKRIVDVATELGLIAALYRHGDPNAHILASTELQRQQVETFRRAFLPFELHSSPRDFEAIGPPVKMLLLTSGTNSQKVMQHCQGVFPELTLYKERHFVDICGASVNKAAGIKQLCKALGSHIEEAVCFGDGNNDIEFLQEAGLGFAMANAKLEVKAVANRVTRFSNEEDGVAVELEEMLAQGLFGPPTGVVSLL